MKGTVEKYGPTWRVRYEAGTKANGKRDQRSKAGFKTKREAMAYLSEVEDLLRKGIVLDASKLTVGEFLDVWLEGKLALRPSTRRCYESHVRVYLKPLLGQVRLVSLRADHIDACYAAVREGKVRKAPSAASVKRLHATLHSALQTAYKRRLIAHNPAGQVELESVPRPERGVWSPSQLAHFLASTANDRLGSAYSLLANTGLRRGELCGLRWIDLDLESRTLVVAQQHVEVGRKIMVGEPKTKRGFREVALDRATVAVLRSHKAAQATERLAWGEAYADRGLVFAREDGSPYRPEYVTRHFLQLAKDAGLPRIVLHGLRHTHATHALAAGVDMVVVSRRLGHSSLSLTADTYTHVLPEVQREAAELIAGMLAQAAARPVGITPV